MGTVMKPGMDLGKHVEDKELLDRNDRRAGKVDDLLLELPETDDPGGTVDEPEVVAIIAGPLALARNLPGPLYRLARLFYRVFGIGDPRPVEIPWNRVSTIGVVVRADIDRREVGLTMLADAVDRRLIGRIPGAGTRP